MSEETDSRAELPLDQGLLGMQGFNAARAERYRTEISKLLADRMSPFSRWSAGIGSIMLLITLGVLPVIGLSRTPIFEGLQETRWTFALAFIATTGLLCGWLLWIAVKGAYGRHSGDLVAAAIAFIFCGGSGFACLQIAWATDDPVLRTKMLFSGALFLALVFGCLLVTLLQRMHRQIQEKLLRIDYHVAELIAKSAE
jgi:hypothetical protein